MKCIYFDCVCGASGDMILSCLLDLGVPVEWLQEQLARLPIHGVSISVEKVSRSGISCNHLLVDAPHQHEHRHPHDILDIIRKAGFSDGVCGKSEKILMRLAQAEATVHGVAVEKVHFHEIGAVDTIVDIAGAALCLEYLDAEEVRFSPLTHGHGTINTSHGVMPVPAPATMELMKGFAARRLDIEGEILTPTGCAVLTTLGTQAGGMPDGVVEKTGYGCGEKVFDSRPNMLRAVLVKTAQAVGSAEVVSVIESDMDHISGEVMGYAAGLLMESGALDVSWCPLYMKKGRPGYRLTVVCREPDLPTLADIILKETRTLGVRYREHRRIVAERTERTSLFMDSPIREKECSFQGKSFTKPEFESLASLARQSGRPLQDIAEEYVRWKGTGPSATPDTAGK